MPRLLSRQESGPTSRMSALGDGVPINGLDEQATRRAHMREQTTACQAAERRLKFPPILRTDYDYHTQVAARLAEVRAELSRIQADHQTWLRDHGWEGE